MKASWLHLRHRHWTPFRHYSSTPHIHPLRILFCGSDDFSIFSLRALAALPPSLVSSIDVVCRAPKRTGRGLRTLTYPPIHAAASALGLPLHPLATFTSWTPPPADLIVAVSFGLLVPPRILSHARFGGVNLHPSYLPDLSGPAPIHWALLYGDSHAGATLQTLHPSHFDGGAIIAQSARPGLPLAGLDLGSATAALGQECASLLVQSIKAGTFSRPGAAQSGGEERHAPKLTPEDAHITGSWTASELRRRAMVLGPLWEDEVHATLTGKKKRVQYAAWEDVPSRMVDGATVQLGGATWEAVALRLGEVPRLAFRTADGAFVAPKSVKIEGETWKDVEALVGRVFQ